MCHEFFDSGDDLEWVEAGYGGAVCGSDAAGSVTKDDGYGGDVLLWFDEFFVVVGLVCE